MQPLKLTKAAPYRRTTENKFERPRTCSVQSRIMKKAAIASGPLPTLVCAWCKGVIRVGAPKVSHGICRPCVVRSFGKVSRRGARAARSLAA